MSLVMRMLGAVIVAIAISAFPLAAAPDLPAEEILAKSLEAMGPPIQYRVVAGEVSSVVAIKDLGGDVGVATRVESIGPHVEKVTLTTAKLAYEWWPKTGLAIDMSALYDASRDKATGLRQGSRAEATNRLLESETIDGVEHYVIETVMPKTLAQGVARTSPGRQEVSGTKRSWINAQTFSLRKTTTALGDFDFVDITRGIDLPTDRFLPPTGIAIQKVVTWDEYGEAAAAAMTPKVATAKKTLRRTVAPPIWDPEKKRWKGSAPTGWTQAEWDKKVESMPSKPFEIARSPAEKREETRRVILYGNVALVALLAAFAAYRHWSKLWSPRASLPPANRR